jgi:Leucine-rich repeat (LRR) protein
MCKNITTLHIHNCKNLKTLPNEIGELDNLADLVVAHCGLESIPETVGKNVNLESFMVHNNNIKTIPLGLGNCSKLVMLDLSSNQIQEIPHEVFLDEEGLSKIADGDYSDVVGDNFKLKDLSFINMESNPLSSESENFLEILSGL